MYRKVIGFKLGFYFFLKIEFWLFKAQHLGTRGICICILIGLA